MTARCPRCGRYMGEQCHATHPCVGGFLGTGMQGSEYVAMHGNEEQKAAYEAGDVNRRFMVAIKLARARREGPFA